MRWKEWDGGRSERRRGVRRKSEGEGCEDEGWKEWEEDGGRTRGGRRGRAGGGV